MTSLTRQTRDGHIVLAGPLSRLTDAVRLEHVARILAVLILAGLAWVSCSDEELEKRPGCVGGRNCAEGFAGRGIGVNW